MTDVSKMDRDTVHKTGTWNSVQRRHETEVHPCLSCCISTVLYRFLSRPILEGPEIYDVHS